MNNSVTVEQLARLGSKGTDLAVGPAADDGTPILGKGDAVTVEVWDLDTKQLSARACVPHTDVLP